MEFYKTFIENLSNPEKTDELLYQAKVLHKDIYPDLKILSDLLKNINSTERVTLVEQLKSNVKITKEKLLSELTTCKKSIKSMIEEVSRLFKRLGITFTETSLYEFKKLKSISIKEQIDQAIMVIDGLQISNKKLKREISDCEESNIKMEQIMKKVINKIKKIYKKLDIKFTEFSLDEFQKEKEIGFEEQLTLIEDMVEGLKRSNSTLRRELKMSESKYKINMRKCEKTLKKILYNIKKVYGLLEITYAEPSQSEIFDFGFEKQLKLIGNMIQSLKMLNKKKSQELTKWPRVLSRICNGISEIAKRVGIEIKRERLNDPNYCLELINKILNENKFKI